MKQLVQFSLLFLFLFAACNTVQDVPAPAPADDMLSYIKQLGFRPSEIEDKGDYYLVDGDISFPKNTKIETNCESHLFPDALETRQYGSQSYIGFNAQPNITIRIDPSMAVHTATIQQAVAAWNDIPNCRAKFNFTTASNQNVLIRASRTEDNIGAFTCGRAFPPLNGRASGELLINRNLGVMEFNTPQLRGTIIHELGHILGLRHTNWLPAGEVKDAVRLTENITNPVTATNIMGTPTGNDPLSMMNGSTCGISPATLSANDIIAIQTI